jgi:hypothetical protein
MSFDVGRGDIPTSWPETVYAPRLLASAGFLSLAN